MTRDTQDTSTCLQPPTFRREVGNASGASRSASGDQVASHPEHGA